MSQLPTRSSAINLSQYNQGAPLVVSQPILTNSPPTASATNAPPQYQQPPAPTTHTSAPTTHRRTQPNVLGGGFLRPLTRVGEAAQIGRTQSSATLDNLTRPTSPSTVTPSPLLEAPAMVRRSADGDGSAGSHESRRRELARRSGTMDTSYRSHGW